MPEHDTAVRPYSLQKPSFQLKWFIKVSGPLFPEAGCDGTVPFLERAAFWWNRGAEVTTSPIHFTLKWRIASVGVKSWSKDHWGQGQIFFHWLQQILYLILCKKLLHPNLQSAGQYQTWCLFPLKLNANEGCSCDLDGERAQCLADTPWRHLRCKAG